MKVVWTEQNHIEEVKYGTKLHNMQYLGERPDKVIIAINEVKGHALTKQLIHYIKACLMPALTLKTDVEICFVCE